MRAAELDKHVIVEKPFAGAYVPGTPEWRGAYIGCRKRAPDDCSADYDKEQDPAGKALTLSLSGYNVLTYIHAFVHAGGNLL